ncbi:hypothetical protein ACFO0S_02900 [Chryseomicrobium palamuruense]|uniref:Lipoprotein n=1 Tax=Chryseomicrobium palamuruense TaxID=682973 RepID=A0ABV8UTX8_9BACL
MEKVKAGQKWYKVGAAAFLSVGLLAACGDGVDQDNIDDGTEQEIEEDVNDTGEEVEQEVDETEDEEDSE